MHFLLINYFGRQWLACEIQGHGFEYSSVQIFVSKNNNLSSQYHMEPRWVSNRTITRTVLSRWVILTSTAQG